MEEKNSETGFISDFIKAKQEFKKTGLDGSNTHLKSKYASLTKIYEAVEDALHNHNICITHERYVEEGKTYLKTRLLHVSGHFIQDQCIVESEKPGNQGHGAALTYNKKYAVLALCAIHADKDDDGQEEQNYIEKKQYTKQEQLYNQRISSVQKKQLEDEAIPLDDEIYEIILKGFGINSWSELTTDKFDSALNTIRQAKD